MRTISFWLLGVGGVGAALVVDVGEEPAQRGDGHGVAAWRAVSRRPAMTSSMRSCRMASLRSPTVATPIIWFHSRLSR